MNTVVEMEPRVGAGDVEIILVGQSYTLRPTLNAVLTISRQYGGIRGAIDQVMKMDLDAIVNIVQLGLGPQVARTMKDLPERIWRSGLTDNQSALLSRCIEYLTILANGGKPLPANEEARDDTNNPPIPPMH